MKQRTLVVLVASLMVLGGIIGQSPMVSAGSSQEKGAEHRFRVGKLNNKWKVYDPGNPQNRVIVAKRGDVVVWTPVGTDIFVNFPDGTIFGIEEGYAGDGKNLALTVSSDAEPGQYTYSIFCAKEGKFATGDSPPVIIIQ